jgi:hypothetical protein
MEEVKGSSPLCSTTIFCYTSLDLGQLAQLARASRLHREGRGFESLIAHQEKEPKYIGSFS